VGNGNTIYRRSAWEELQFDETIKTAEDKLWLKEMVARDYGFAYIPKPCAITKYRGSLRYMFTKGYVDARAARGSNIAPMKIMHLGGAVKNILLNGLNGKIDPQTLLRILSSTLGQFFGSYKDYKNSNFFIL
jgi:hypothetical protein